MTWFTRCWFRGLVLVVCVVSVLAPSLALMDSIACSIDARQEEDDDDHISVAETECTVPAARQRRPHGDALIPRPASERVSVPRTIDLPVAAGLDVFRPAVPVPLIC